MGEPVAEGSTFPKRPKRRRRRWSWVVLGLLAALVATALVSRHVLMRRAERRVAKARAGLSFQLVPLEELPTLWGPEPRPEDNAAPLYEEACAKLEALLDGHRAAPDGQGPDLGQELGHFFEAYWALLVEEADRMPSVQAEGDTGRNATEPQAPGRRPLSLDVKGAREFLANFDEVFDLRDRATREPCYRRRETPRMSLGSRSVDGDRIGNLARLTLLEALVDSHEEAWDTAYDRMCTLLLMAAHVEQEREGTSQLITVVMRYLAAEPLAAMIHRRPPSREASSRLRRLLSTDAAARIRDVFAAEAVVQFPFLDRFRGGRIRAPSMASLRRWFDEYFVLEQQAKCLETMDRHMRATASEGAATLSRYRSMEEALFTSCEKDSELNLASLAVPTLRLVAQAIFEDQARASMMCVALDLAERRQTDGEYPATLAGPPETAQLPRDPFSGEAFRYRREGEGFVLWSVGPDGDDDGGKAPEELDADLEDDGDLVFRVPPEPPEAEASSDEEGEAEQPAPGDLPPDPREP